jgi:alpha-beta hydrolase superfamily lysophospholipase
VRSALAIDVEGATLAAWHYPGSNGAVVVMAGGAGIAKELATDRFAARFHAAGFSVLAFDYRGFGRSGGAPRGVVNVRTQLDDWAAAVEAGRDLEEVDADRVGIWGASLSGGHVLRVAARDHGIAAVVAQNPLTDGLLALPNALRHETLAVALRFPIIAGWDAFRGLFARPPILVPLAGPRGTVAMLTTPDAQQAQEALDPGGRCPEAFQCLLRSSAATREQRD